KSVSIVIPNPRVVGFGACPHTSDPKLVKISVSDKIPRTWEVDVFTLSTRVWKIVYTGAPFKACDFSWFQVFVDGVIYFRAYDDEIWDPESTVNFLISFDFKSEKFGEACLPHRLVLAHLDVAKVEGKSLYGDVLGFRNNGEVVMQIDDDNNNEEYRIEVYDLLSGHINGVGINGKQGNDDEGGLVVGITGNWFTD
nr:hypothetical protein [Tanacetum cinerariifolium]